MSKIKTKTLTLWACIALTPIMFSCTLIITSCDLPTDEELAAENLRRQQVALNNLKLTLTDMHREDLNGSCQYTPSAWSQELECNANNPLGYTESWLCYGVRENAPCRLRPAE